MHMHNFSFRGFGDRMRGLDAVAEMNGGAALFED
jgi:hypothetical protein